MLLYDLNEFMRLSQVLNLQLSVKDVGCNNIAAIITFKKNLHEHERDILMQVLTYLDLAYGQRKRRLGPLAVLHPLRATALLAQAQDQLKLLDLLACLLHDKLEDLTPASLGKSIWDELEAGFQTLLKSIDPKDEWFLMERIDWLTRHPKEPYFKSIGRLLDHARQTPEIVSIKLADRLDNTLDLHVDIEDPIQGIDFFATVFELLYLNSFPGFRSERGCPPASPLTGSERLYQIFKNAVLMSMVRQREVVLHDRTAKNLFEALALASMKEAQRIVLHVFGYHQTDPRKQRQLLMEVMKYAQDGHLDKVTLPHSERRLDGLFLSLVKDSDPAVKQKRLEELYQDRDLMVEAAMAFVIIFQSFFMDPAYYVKGISSEGIHPHA